MMIVFLMIVFLIILFLFVLFLLALRGRTGHPGLNALRGWSYAHRGLHGNGIPENSMGAFRAALENGYGVELDVHLLADGNLAIMHDSSLQRMTGCEIDLEDLTTQQLKDYHLDGTEETIPEFRSVLNLFSGKAPLIIELKTRGGNADLLCQATCEMLDTYDGPYCLESFDPRCVYWLKKHRPDIIRGQLSENFIPQKSYTSNVPKILRWLMTYNLPTFVTKPDFLAYRYADRKTVTNLITLKLWEVQGVSWTLKSQQEYDTAVKEGWIPIFEGFRP